MSGEAGFVDHQLRRLILGQCASGAGLGNALSRVGTACRGRKNVSAETFLC